MPFHTLSDLLQHNLGVLGYHTPTPIQEKALPALLRKRDVMGAAMTGTGKTAAYGLALLQMVGTQAWDGAPKPEALVLVPTRELCDQVTQALRSLGEGSMLRILGISGGKTIAKQSASLAKGAHVVVATPGRLLELWKQEVVTLGHIAHLVIDEADTMFDMGFSKELEQVIALLPPKRQNILFSATLTSAVKRLGQTLLHKPLLIETDRIDSLKSTITQVVHPVDAEQKPDLPAYLLGRRNDPQVLVFTRTKAIADAVSEHLALCGLKCQTLHGDKTQGERERAMRSFKEQKVPILVATDIAARGLDIVGLDVVINYDIPHIATDYIHRIGRTGRAGRSGVAITLLATNEQTSWRKIEPLLDAAPRVEAVKGFEPSVVEKPKKTYDKSLSKEQTKSKKTDGAFGNRAKKVSKPKYATKRDAPNGIEAKPRSVKKSGARA